MDTYVSGKNINTYLKEVQDHGYLWKGVKNRCNMETWDFKCLCDILFLQNNWWETNRIMEEKRIPPNQNSFRWSPDLGQRRRFSAMGLGLSFLYKICTAWIDSYMGPSESWTPHDTRNNINSRYIVGLNVKQK